MPIFVLQSCADHGDMRAGELETNHGSVLTPGVALPTVLGQVPCVVPSILDKVAPQSPIIIYYTDIITMTSVDVICKHTDPHGAFSPLHMFAGCSSQLRPVILALCPPECLIDISERLKGDTWQLDLGAHGRLSVTAEAFSDAARLLQPDLVISPVPVIPQAAAALGRKRGQATFREETHAAAVESAMQWYIALTRKMERPRVVVSLPLSWALPTYMKAFDAMIQGAPAVALTGSLTSLAEIESANVAQPDEARESALAAVLEPGLRDIPPHVMRLLLPTAGHSPDDVLRAWSLGIDCVASQTASFLVDSESLIVGCPSSPQMMMKGRVSEFALAGEARAAPDIVERRNPTAPQHRLMDVRAAGATDTRSPADLCHGLRCKCPSCTHPHSIAYLRHLVMTSELTGEVLLASHGLGWLTAVGSHFREEILYVNNFNR